MAFDSVAVCVVVWFNENIILIGQEQQVACADIETHTGSLASEPNTTLEISPSKWRDKRRNKITEKESREEVCCRKAKGTRLASESQSVGRTHMLLWYVLHTCVFWVGI